MITESYHRNTKLNPAPNFQWTHCHFIGNNFPSQIYCVLLCFPRQKTCGRSAFINSFFVVIPFYTLHVLGWYFSNKIYCLLTIRSACIDSIIYFFGYLFRFLLNVLLYFFFLFFTFFKFDYWKDADVKKRKEINQCLHVYLIQETFAIRGSDCLLLEHFEAIFIYGLILN